MADNQSPDNKPHNPNPLNPPTKEMRSYWEALGQFIHEFSQIEKMLFVVLCRFSGVTIPVARAIFSGTRIDTAIKLIGRLREVNPPAEDDLSEVFTQLRLINDARNDIVHYGTDFNEGTEYSVSNKLVALDDDRLKTRDVSAETLAEMTADLKKISAHLSAHFLHGWVPPEVVHHITHERRLGAWRYKPPRPTPQGRRTRNTTPER